MTDAASTPIPATAARLDWRAPALPIVAGGVVAALAVADGGYFPTSWGWAGVALGWVAVLAALARVTAPVSRAEGTYVAALAAFTCWIALSLLWTTNGSQTWLEVLRVLVLPVGVLAVCLLARRRAVGALTGALFAATALIALYSLATRLFPERLGEFDPVAVYRLAAPFGYWNALGIFATMGSLLALGIAARSPWLAARAVAAAALLVLVPTIYFTYSRGSWAALGIAVVVAVALDPRRLQLVAAIAALGIAPAAGVLLASRSEALTHLEAKLGQASHDGHRLALELLVLAAANAVVAVVFALVERRISLGTALRRRLDLALAAAALVAVVGGLVAAGGPVALGRHAKDAFAAPPPQFGVNLNKRLFSFSGNGRADLWRAGVDDFRAHPLLGSGAGSFEQYWLRHRRTGMKVRDAHSLYVEVLGELGPLGLALLLVAFATPLVALRRARRHPLVPAAAAAYVAYLAHAGADWDWEMLSLTLAALLCGAAVLIAARPETRAERPLATRARTLAVGAVIVAIAVAFVGLVGNIELSRAGKAARAGDWPAAAKHARRAHTWAPWSSEPYQQLGEAQLGQGRTRAAQQSFRAAIAKSPTDWSLWFDLARATTGRAQAVALAHAKRLDPLGPEIAQLEQELAAQGELTLGK